MRINLGCGFDKREGYLNVDKDPSCEPDQIVDLDVLPWPWEDNAADEVLLKHVLEHLGADSRTYLDIIKELWRIAKPSTTVTVIVPHPRHDHFVNDPTHVRAITPGGLELFSQTRNREWIEKGMGNSPLGLQLGIDFEIASINMVPDDPWRGQFKRGKLTSARLAEAARKYNNVIVETTIVLRAIKPLAG